MKKVFLRSLIITLILQISGIFSFTPFISELFDYRIVIAQSPSFPIFSVYRDAAGWENITTSAQTLSWDTPVSSNAEIPINGTNTSFDMQVWGHYLVMYSVPVESSWGSDRSEIQSWLRINGSAASPYSYSSSYIRRVDGDFEWYNEWAVVVDVAAGDDVELRMQKTDTHSATERRTANRSGINLLKLDDNWNYARVRPSSAQAITPVWQSVNLWTNDELDSAGYSISGNDVTLKEAGKYLVTYSLGAVTTWTDRTNNETRLTLWGMEIDATRSTAYIRAQRWSFTGIASYVGIIESSSINQVLNLEVRRESSLQGTTNDTIPLKSWLTITKLPDSADYVRVWELGGGQDISNTATPLTFDTTIEQGTSLVHNGVSESEIDITTAWDYLMFHSIYNAQEVENNASRENPYLRWQVSWIDVEYWVSGSYNRHSDDGDGITKSSASSAWVILTWLWVSDTLELIQQNEASNGLSVYSANRMWIQGVSLLSLFAWDAFLSQGTYRFRDDSSDFDNGSWWIAGESTDIANISKNQTIRLRTKIENTWVENYDDASRFELQWSETSWSCNSWLSWTSISESNDAWEMVDTPHISPNAESSAIPLLSNPSWNIHIQSEWYHGLDGETLLTGSWVFISGSQKEYEFSMRATSYALDNQNYCFRLFNTIEASPLWVNNYSKIQLWSTPVVLDNIWGEAWKITAPANGWWTTVTFTWWPYTTPVIVWRTNTYNDWNEALVFEAQNVTSTWAQVRLCDSNASNATGCQAHLEETIWYIVVDASQTSSVEGIESWVFSADESFDTAGGSITTSYWETFSTTPYVFTSVQTTNGSSPIVTRVSASGISNFTWGICQQQWSEDDCNALHPTEIFGWIAVDPTMNPFFRNMTHYRWYENNGAITPINALASENTTLSVLPVNNQIRLRMLLQNSVPELPSWVLSMRLQYAAWLSCETIPIWSEVWTLWWGEDWLHFVTDSLLFWWGHNLQSYSESLPTVDNPNVIPAWEWWEWDFSLIKNVAAPWDEYCFRVVTENNDEIEYSAYAKINTSDSVAPFISSFTPNSWSLMPIGNFVLDYVLWDSDSWIDTSMYTLSIQRFNAWVFWNDISWSYESLDDITQTWATFSINWLEFWRYRIWFEIFDNAWNSTFVIHELYVDEPELIISTPEINIWDIDDTLLITSAETLRVEVRTIWAAFRVNMEKQTDLQNPPDIVGDWDGVKGFWYSPDPFITTNSFWSWITIAGESRDLNIDGEKNIYTYDIKYSVLLDMQEDYSAGDYESLMDFIIELDY